MQTADMIQPSEDPEPNIVPFPSIKSANSVSFNDIHLIEKQHRFSISSQPSQPSASSASAARKPQENAYIPTSAASRTNSGSSLCPSTSNNDFLQINYNHSHSLKLSNKKKSSKTIISSPQDPPLPFINYLQKQDDEKLHILIGSTGSVATIKVPLIIDKLYKIYGNKVSIQLIVTDASNHFLKGLKINNQVKIWRDSDEWIKTNTINKNENLVLHTELRKWADCLLIAPLSANTLAKITNGICDNLLTSIVRSWNPIKPILIAPAMNTFMYTHPMTRKHISQLTQDCPYIEVLKPVEKVLVCGDIGMGGMREWSDIVEILRKKLIGVTIEKDRKFEHDNHSSDDDEDDDDDSDRNSDNSDSDDDSDDDSEEDGDDEKDSNRDDNSDSDLIFEADHE